MNRFSKKLQALKEQGRYRELRRPAGIDLTSNDYLGMRAHPKLRAAAIQALEGGMDIGAGGSRLLRGNCPEHEALEAFAAKYFGAERVLYFATGYQANAAIFQALPGRQDVIIYDALIHASAREGIAHSPAKSLKVAHNDLNAYEVALKWARDSAAVIWIAVESVYSMDGDLAPLGTLKKLAEKYDAVLIVDEAHGTGVFGETGKGCTENLGHDNLITLHTCGKALGVAGGIVCGPTTVIETLINTARGFIYSTAPMPLQAHLTRVALELVRDEPERRERLFALIAFCKTILPVSEINSPIIPIVFGGDTRTLEIAAKIQNEGFDIRAIRPPTVPEGTSRLRLSVGVHLDEKILTAFADCLSDLLRKEAA